MGPGSHGCWQVLPVQSAVQPSAAPHCLTGLWTDSPQSPACYSARSGWGQSVLFLVRQHIKQRGLSSFYTFYNSFRVSALKDWLLLYLPDCPEEVHPLPAESSRPHQYETVSTCNSTIFLKCVVVHRAWIIGKKVSAQHLDNILQWLWQYSC